MPLGPCVMVPTEEASIQKTEEKLEAIENLEMRVGSAYLVILTSLTYPQQTSSKSEFFQYLPFHTTERTFSSEMSHLCWKNATQVRQ